MKTSHFFSVLSLLLFFSFSNVSAQKNKAVDVIKSYYTAVDAGDGMAVEKFFTADFMASVPVSPVPFDGAGFKMMGQGFKQAFPDMKHDILDWIVDDKKVAVKGIFKGTNTGSMQGNPPTGKMVNLPFNTLFYLDNDWKIKSVNVQFDNTTFMAQLMPDILSPDKIKAIAVEVYDAIAKHDLDKFATFLADDAMDYGQGPEPIKGKAAIAEGIKGFFGAFPDYKVAVEGMAVSGNRVYVRNTLSGTQTKPLMMFPATGKMIKWSDTDIIEFNKEGKMVAHWANNPNEPLYQLGFGAFANPNTGIVLDIYEKFRKRDVAGITASVTSNFELDVKDHPIVPKTEIQKGAEGLANWLKEYATLVQNNKLEPQGFFAEGDDVVVPLTVEYTNKATGKSYSVSLIQQWRFKDGKAIWLKAIGGKPVEIMMTTKK